LPLSTMIAERRNRGFQKICIYMLVTIKRKEYRDG
jgi:hypothetical protein